MFTWKNTKNTVNASESGGAEKKKGNIDRILREPIEERIRVILEPLNEQILTLTQLLNQLILDYLVKTIPTAGSRTIVKQVGWIL